MQKKKTQHFFYVKRSYNFQNQILKEMIEDKQKGHFYRKEWEFLIQLVWK